jgi:hypothetical protein
MSSQYDVARCKSYFLLSQLVLLAAAAMTVDLKCQRVYKWNSIWQNTEQWGINLLMPYTYSIMYPLNAIQSPLSHQPHDKE